jgi:hypothetical protein
MTQSIAALVAILCGGCFAAWVLTIYDQVREDEARTKRELEYFYRNNTPQEDE